MEDRLSELPDSLILEILSLMPKEDIVRTTILSKRWKDLWTSVPFLDFHVKDPVVRTRVFLHEFLRRWKGVCIRNFDTSFSTATSCSNFNLDSWVRFATEKKVEKLCLDLAFDWRKPSPELQLQPLPRCVYSCSSIEELWIRGCNLEIQERGVQWDNLTSLYIEAICLSEEVISQVVSSAPRLESFELRLRSSDHNLKIESSSLKTLTVTRYNVDARRRDPARYAEITIRAPKLESLHLRGNAYRHCDLQMDGDESLLKSLTLCFYEKWCGELRQTLLQILPTIPQLVEEVTLSPCAFKMLGYIMQLRAKQFVFPLQFRNVNKLKLDGGPITPKEVAALTQMFPRVETLLIHWKIDDWYPFFLRSLSLTTTYKDSDVKPCLNQLRTVEITLYANYDRSEFQLIFNLLRKHATKPVLRKGERVLKMMLDELKAKCKLKRLRPQTWLTILALSTAAGLNSYFAFLM